MKGVKLSKMPLYQHPFVDVFKTFKVFEYKDAEKIKGATESVNKAIRRKVLQLKDSSIQIPSPKSSLHSLGLTGKFIYIQLLATPQPFSIHFDYLVDAKHVTRLSFSNVFKSPQVSNTVNLQIPLQLSEKWTVVCVHAMKLLETHRVCKAGSKSAAMRSLQVCGNVGVRGVYTSDIEYTVKVRLPER